MAADRSAGVQQGRTWFVFLCDHEEYHGDYARPWPSEVGHTADEFTECSCGRSLRPVRVVEAVSPEPRPTDKELLERLRQLVAEDEQRLGPVPESVMREVAEAWPDAREGEQEAVQKMQRLTDQVKERTERIGATLEGAPPDPSVASELRLTASRLLDPAYHWYEHAAVTLERLAEELEEGERA